MIRLRIASMHKPRIVRWLPSFSLALSSRLVTVAGAQSMQRAISLTVLSVAASIVASSSRFERPRFRWPVHPSSVIVSIRLFAYLSSRCPLYASGHEELDWSLPCSAPESSLWPGQRLASSRLACMVSRGCMWSHGQFQSWHGAENLLLALCPDGDSAARILEC